MIDVPMLLDVLGVQVDHRRGAELWSRCPFPWHVEDDTPSWSIVDRPGEHDHGFNRCFGCQAGGGAVYLVLERVGLSGYRAAWDWVRERGLDGDPPPTESVSVEVRLPRPGGFRLPPEVRGVGDASRWPTPARRYALGRGIADWQVAQWGIGYAADGRLAGRIVIPYADERGRLQSYSARTFCADEPKYLTPDRREGPDLDAVFGAACWPRRADRREVFVCEGAVDALACQLAGARSVAALNGSRLTPGQAARLSTFRQIAIVTDGDEAGERIADQLGAFARWGEVRRVRLPGGMDPGALVQGGRSDLLSQALGVAPERRVLHARDDR
jgi:DNA primase